MTTRVKPTANSSAKWRAIERPNMKTNSRTPKNTAAFTLTEAVIVVIIIGLLAAVILPELQRTKAKNNRISCVGRNKHIGDAYRVFASDNGDRYPLQATNNPYIYQPGGSGTAPGSVVSTNAEAWQVFQALWNELHSPKILLCPSDRARSTSFRVTDFNGLAGAPGTITTTSLGHPSNRNIAVSYAPQTLADESRPIGLLNVDRCINFATAATAATTPGAASGTRVVVNSPATAASLFFVAGPGFGFHRLDGNLAYADGSVQQVSGAHFQTALVNAGTAYGWGTATSNGFGAAVFLLP